MIRKTFSLIVALALASLLCAMPVAAQPPGPPQVHIFYGEVTIDANPAPDGTTVSAHIGSLSWSTTTKGGKYGYAPPEGEGYLSIPADDANTPEKDGGEDGDEITFKVNGRVAATDTFANGMVTELNLSISTAGVTYYTLTVDVSPSGAGRVSLSPSVSGNQYESGTTVTLTANPASAYVFDRWSGDLTGSTNPTTIVMDEDKAITAHFRQVVAGQYVLTISSVAGGSVTTPGEGTFAYDEGEVLELVANPDDGYKFDGWTGDVDTVADIHEPTTTITMHGDKLLTAHFRQTAAVQYTLTVSSTTGGSVITPGEGTFAYDEGEVVELVAEADAGYHFDAWTGDVARVAKVNKAKTTITMDADKSISASFTEGPAPSGLSRNWIIAIIVIVVVVIVVVFIVMRRRSYM